MFACIYIPDFTVAAVLRAEPELRGQAVAVLEGEPPLCYVVGANEAARHLGLEIGITRAQAELFAAAVNDQARRQTSDARRQFENRGTKNKEPRTRSGSNEERRTENEHRPIDRKTENGTLLVYPPEHTNNGHELGNPMRAGVRRPKTCPGGLFLRHRSATQESAAHAALLDAAYAFSPRVEDTAPDTVLLDVDGLQRLFGPPAAIAQQIAARVHALGLDAHVAMAANPEAAEHAARGFAGSTVLPAGREAERLGPLPLEILFAAERAFVFRQPNRRDQQRKIADRLVRMQETLDRWGIRNFRGLASLPPISLSERLGADGVRLQKLASGSGHRELVFSEPPLHFEEAIELDYPVDLVEPLAFLLSRMLDQLCARLNARALATNELLLRMELEHRAADEATTSPDELAHKQHITERRITLPVAMNDAKLFLKLLQLELSANPPGAPVRKLWLVSEPARPRLGQAGLFQPAAPEPEKLELTLARIHKLLAVRGELRAGSPALLDTHQPDSFRIVRFTPTEKDAAIETTPPAKTADTARMALRRFRPRLPAEVEVHDGAPVRLICEDAGVRTAVHHNIVWSAGPWKADGNWWEQKQTLDAGRSTLDKDVRHQTSDVKVQTSDAIHEERRGTKNEELPNGEQRTENGERPGELFARDEWDIALAVTHATKEKRERSTEIVLYRLVCDRVERAWFLEGVYD